MAAPPSFVFDFADDASAAPTGAEHSNPILVNLDPGMDFSSNAPTTTTDSAATHLSRTPRPLKASLPLLYSPSLLDLEEEDDFIGSEMDGGATSNANTNSLRSGTYGGDAVERARITRGSSRHLRVSTLHQRVYHQDDQLSPLAYPMSLSPSPTDEKAPALPINGHGPQYDVPTTPLTPSSSKDKLRAFYAHSYPSTPFQRLQHHGSVLLSRLFALPLAVFRAVRNLLHRLDSPLLWLSLYFFLNLGLTLYNKSVLIHFPFPYTLTALHAFCGSVGTWVLLRLEANQARKEAGAEVSTKARPSVYQQQQQPATRSISSLGVPNLKGKELVVLFLFSILYTVNIVVSNASLRLVTVPFHQVVRASAPFFTILFSAVLLGKRSSKEKLLSLIPVVAGVGFATYGDYYFTALGFFLTLLGTLLAAMKTILTNLILVKPNAATLPTTAPGSEPHSQPHPHGHASFVQMPTSPGLYPTSIDEKAAHDQLRSPSQFPSRLPIGDGAVPMAYSPSPLPSPSLPPVSLPSPTTQSTFPPNFFSSLFHLTVNHFFPPTPTSSPVYTTKQLSNELSHTPTTLTASLGGAGKGLFDFPKLSLTPMHLLYLLSPLAFMQTTLLAHFTGELDRVRWHLFHSSSSAVAAGMAINGAGVTEHNYERWYLLLNGLMAFVLNVVSFNANRRVGPLGMSVAANVKQVLTILCAVVIFDLTITPANGLGIFLTLIGGALYARAELKEKGKLRGKRLG